MEPPENDPALGPLANKLHRLRWLKRKPETRERYDIGEIAETVSRLYVEDQIRRTRDQFALSGGTEDQIRAEVEEIRARRPLLNRNYLSDLLSGKRRNPTKDMIEYLALFFEVSPVYFFEGNERTSETSAAEDEVEMLVAVTQLYRTLKEGGQENAGELLTAFMRGSSELDPATVTGMLRMQLAAVKIARNGELDPLT